jgi:hypothetical protein
MMGAAWFGNCLFTTPSIIVRGILPQAVLSGGY